MCFPCTIFNQSEEKCVTRYSLTEITRGGEEGNSYLPTSLPPAFEIIIEESLLNVAWADKKTGKRTFVRETIKPKQASTED